MNIFIFEHFVNLFNSFPSIIRSIPALDCLELLERSSARALERSKSSGSFRPDLRVFTAHLRFNSDAHSKCQLRSRPGFRAVRTTRAARALERSSARNLEIPALSRNTTWLVIYKLTVHCHGHCWIPSSAPISSRSIGSSARNLSNTSGFFSGW